MRNSDDATFDDRYCGVAAADNRAMIYKPRRGTEIYNTARDGDERAGVGGRFLIKNLGISRGGVVRTYVARRFVCRAQY